MSGGKLYVIKFAFFIEHTEGERGTEKERGRLTKKMCHIYEQVKGIYIDNWNLWAGLLL